MRDTIDDLEERGIFTLIEDGLYVTLSMSSAKPLNSNFRPLGL